MRILLSIICLCLINCATAKNDYTQSMAASRSRDVSRILNQWGPPDERIMQGNGDELLIYRTRSPMVPTQASPSVGVSVSGKGRPVIVTQQQNPLLTQSEATAVVCVTVVVVRRGSIVSMKSQGAGCPRLSN